MTYPIRAESRLSTALACFLLVAVAWASAFWEEVIRETATGARWAVLAGNVGLGMALLMTALRVRHDLRGRRRAEETLAQQAQELTCKGAQLEATREAADAANVAKSNFLANMSHEIRTPIAAILGYSDLMLDPARGASARHNDLHAIRRNGQHLLEVINDVLDLSKIEAGGMTVERIPTDLPRIAAEAVSLTRPHAIEKGLDLSLQFTTSLPQIGLTDPLRLRQVLINLLGNAIKFTPHGSVTLRVACLTPCLTDSQITFEVMDTGVGMTEAEQAKLFQPFVQGDVSTTRRFGGTGLGLTISRKFAQMLGGDIAVRSSPGAGTSVTVTVAVGPVLPASLVHNLTEASTNYHVEEPAVDGCESLAGARILLAEDGLDNREILTAYLRGAGANVETVEDGRQAVQQVLAALADGRTYTIVVMDMQMPVLDGYGATSELRRRGYRGAIVALTANAMAEDRARCLLAGCDDYLTKPVNRRALTAAVAQHIRGTDNTPSSVTLEQRRDLAHASAVGSAATGAHASRTIISEIAGDPKLASVLAGFVSRLPDVVVELRQLIDAEALVGVTRLAHKLRGAGGSYGFAELSAAAARVEDQLVAGGSLADAQPDVDYLIEVLRCVSGYDHSAESVPKLAS